MMENIHATSHKRQFHRILKLLILTAAWKDSTSKKTSIHKRLRKRNNFNSIVEFKLCCCSLNFCFSTEFAAELPSICARYKMHSHTMENPTMNLTFSFFPSYYLHTLYVAVVSIFPENGAFDMRRLKEKIKGVLTERKVVSFNSKKRARVSREKNIWTRQTS